jgi:ABC-type phosphate transport system ATPase subunit
VGTTHNSCEFRGNRRSDDGSRIDRRLAGGELVEFDDTDAVFQNPENDRVEDYITGKFG